MKMEWCSNLNARVMLLRVVVRGSNGAITTSLPPYYYNIHTRYFHYYVLLQLHYYVLPHYRIYCYVLLHYRIYCYVRQVMDPLLRITFPGN